jgi:hypothetical protein
MKTGSRSLRPCHCFVCLFMVNCCVLIIDNEGRRNWTRRSATQPKLCRRLKTRLRHISNAWSFEEVVDCCVLNTRERGQDDPNSTLNTARLCQRRSAIWRAPAWVAIVGCALLPPLVPIQEWLGLRWCRTHLLWGCWTKQVFRHRALCCSTT